MKYIIIILLLLLPFKTMAIQWKSDYTGKRYDNKITIEGDPDERNRQMIEDFTSRVKFDKPLTIKFKDSIGNYNVKDAQAVYDPNNNSILLSGNTGTILFPHEFGHFLTDNYGMEKEKELFNKLLYSEIEKMVNSKGISNSRRENIAENVAKFLREDKGYEDNYTSEYDYLNEILKGIGTVRPQSLFANNNNNNMAKTIQDLNGSIVKFPNDNKVYLVDNLVSLFLIF